MHLTDVDFLGTALQRKRDSTHFKRLLNLTPEFQIVVSESDVRSVAESCIQSRFRAAYGTEINEFHVALLTMHCAGALSAVVGISKATQQSLFLEQYTDLPVEQELARILRCEVDRESIVEIGNLVANTNGNSLALFIVLASALSRAGFEYMVFTATEQLRSKFSRLGFETIYLSEANPTRLGLSSKRTGGATTTLNPMSCLEVSNK